MVSRHAVPFDPELGPRRPSKASANPSALQEAGALLLLWSILVINEGAIRLINTQPAAGLSGGRPDVFAVFLGGLFEVVFGLVGLFLGFSAFIIRAHSVLVTRAAMFLQTILGTYVFIVFVFTAPIYRAIDLTAPILTLSLNESRFLIALGILTSCHFCLALQGGQFVFMARMICAATGRDFLKQKSGLTMRAIFWNSNFALSGLWTVITGALVANKVGAGKLMEAFESPPNVGLLPVMTIVTGAVMVAWGLVGVFVAAAAKGVPAFYFPGTGLVYLIAFANYTIVQFGLLKTPPAGAVAMHAGLVFMVIFLGPYFVQLAAREETVEEL